MLSSSKEMNNNNSEILYKQVTKQPYYKSKLYNHYDVKLPNELHQIDLLFLPEDNGYRYALCLVDVASRYKASRALQTKTAEELLNNLKDIYLNDEYLRVPRKLQFDRGGEFNNEMLKEWATPDDEILQKRRSNRTTKSRYRKVQQKVELIINEKGQHVSLVENMNKQLTRLIFKDQIIEELKSGIQNTKWVDKLQDYIDILNNRKTRLINLKPIDAIQMSYVEQPKNNFTKIEKEKYYDIGTEVRRLLNKDEVQDYLTKKIKIELKRATDAYWSLNTYVVIELYIGKDELVMHRIKDKESGLVYKNMYTYFQLTPIKLSVESDEG